MRNDHVLKIIGTTTVKIKIFDGIFQGSTTCERLEKKSIIYYIVK